MSSHKQSKINILIRLWPKGTVAVQSWLDQQGVYRQLAEVYRRYHWIKRIGERAYIRTDDQIDWTGAIYALQKELGLRAHIGAETALGMSGFGHYVPLGDGAPVWLFLQANETRAIPTWFKKNFDKQKVFHYKRANLFSGRWDIALEDKQIQNYSILVSSPERAIFECLYLVPNSISLEHAAVLMEKLRTLRPQMLQGLLERCRSVKIKRLFLHLAELQQQPWFDRLNLDKVKLGKGTRRIGKGGKYIAKYGLSVPDVSRHEGYSEDENEF